MYSKRKKNESIMKEKSQLARHIFKEFKLYLLATLCSLWDFSSPTKEFPPMELLEIKT